MRNKLYALLLSVLILGCEAKKVEKVLVPRTITSNEDFNVYPKNEANVLSVVRLPAQKDATSGQQSKDILGVKFGDTLIRIQPDKADKNFITDKFTVAEFVNTQKTAVLVQAFDSTGLVAPFYLITVKNDKPEVVSLYRASTGAGDQKYTKGLFRVGSSGYLINNDFFVTNVNAKVYVLPRQHPQERIQGEFFLKSADKNTFVFLVPGAFYQVHYPTGDVFTQPLPKSAPKEITNVYKWVQDNFVWVKNGKGISFFKQIDQDKVVDMRRRL
jgi:hypothetical protein